MRVFAIGVIVLAMGALAPVVETAGPTSEVDVCLQFFNDARANRVDANGNPIPSPPLVVHPALVAEGVRHLQEEKKFHYFGDWGCYDAACSPSINQTIRACTSSHPDSDPAADPGYPCVRGDLNPDPEGTNRGHVAGIGAKGSREGRITCSVNVWLNPNDTQSDDLVILNPAFVHVGIAKSGDMWAAFFGWPAVP